MADRKASPREIEEAYLRLLMADPRWILVFEGKALQPGHPVYNWARLAAELGWSRTTVSRLLKAARAGEGASETLRFAMGSDGYQRLLARARKLDGGGDGETGTPSRP